MGRAPQETAMNATFANAVLPLSPVRPHRRFHVGGHALRPEAVAAFNRVLERLGTAPLDEDQIASFSRAVSPRQDATAVPAWILTHMRDAAAIRLMLGDPGWDLLERAADPAHVVSDYLRDHADLIPDRLPVLGRLDDAIVVEAAWSGIGTEVIDYLDYRRLRRLEAAMRGCDERAFRFGRTDWEEARQAEAALVRHLREVGTRSYLPATGGPGRFRIN